MSNETDEYRAEIGLVGAMFADPSIINVVAAELTADDFSGGLIGLGPLFEFLVTMHGAGRKITDFVLLKLEIAKSPIAPAIASDGFLRRLISEGGFAWNAKFFVEKIKKNAALRRMATIAAELSERVKVLDADPKEIREWLDAKVACSGVADASTASSIGDIAKRIAKRLQTPRATTERAIMTGMYGHDEMVGGWMPGELIVLAARPGMGKTAMATQIAKANAHQGRPVLFVSIEMDEEELGSRILATASNVNGRAMRTGSVNEDEIRRIVAAAEDLSCDTLSIWAPPQRLASISSIRAMAKHAKATTGLRLLVVDYIGIVKPENRKVPKHEQIAEISGALKGLAKELHVPVLALCQLNREDVGNEPRLSNLRDSGAIEQDADCVMFLHRERPESPECSWIVAKHRHSSTGSMKVTWIPESTSFIDYSQGRPMVY